MMVDKRLQQQLIAAMNGAEASAAELAQLLSLPVPEVEAGLDSLVQQRKVTRMDTAGGVRYRVGLGPKRVGDLLVEAGQITPQQLQDALAEQTQTGERLGEILIERGHISKQTLGGILQSQRGVTYVDLNTYPVDEQLVRSIPDWLVMQYKVIPLARVNQEILLGMLDPTDVVAMDSVAQALGGRVRPFLIHERDFNSALSKFFGLGKRVGESLREVSQEELAERKSEAVTVEDSSDEAPMIRVFNSILNEAIRSGATDVHLEPDVDVARVRFRVDGILYEKTALPPAVAAAVTSRLKVLAGLDIAERLRPQDGRILVEQDGRQYDLRIATVGTAFGERAAV
ncbi:MAG TPA: ATPase, T2SS/T4P/T4SS family, partial [bacterium]|nr:ATPase, T2SS/T4P/T4SS family [bacterium]